MNYQLSIDDWQLIIQIGTGSPEVVEGRIGSPIKNASDFTE